MPANSIIEIDPIVNRGDKFRPRSVHVPVVFLVLERRPERFRWAIVPANPGRAHRPAQPVPETRLSRQMRSELASPIGMQNRATTPTATTSDRSIDSLGHHIGSDMISD